MFKNYVLSILLALPMFVSAQSVTLLKDVNETGDARPSYLTTDGTYLYYKADNGADGKEIVVSQGTEETTKYFDLLSGTYSSALPGMPPSTLSKTTNLTYPAVINGKFYFRGTKGYTFNALYNSDMAEYATMTFDPETEAASVAIDTLQIYYTAEYNNTVYFSGYKTKMIYSWDGENAPVLLPGQDGVIKSMGVFVRIGDYFVIYGNMLDDATTTDVDESAQGRELIGYNIATGESEYLGDFNASGNSSFTINDFAVVGSKLYFEVNNTLYETDGTAAKTKTVWSPYGFFTLTKVYGYLSEMDGKLLFQGKDVMNAEGDSKYGFQLFSYNPAKWTGARISTINKAGAPGEYESHLPKNYTQMGDYVYYVGKDSAKVTRLFCTDGKTTDVVDTSIVASYQTPVVFMDKLYFVGSNDTYGEEVFVYDPSVQTAVETVTMENEITIYPNPSNGRVKVKGLTSNNAMYEIFNLAGQSVENGFVQNNQINYRVANGVYVLKITDGTTQNTQIISVK